MSRPARCIGTQLRSLTCRNATSRSERSVQKVLSGLRGYGQAAVLKQSLPSHSAPIEASVGHEMEPASYTPKWHRGEAQTVKRDESGWTENPVYRKISDSRREEYFARLFSPLTFPPELLQRIMTHSSHRQAAVIGHSTGLSFLGRRVMSSYFMMFLFASKKLKPSDDIEDITAQSLNTHLMGEYAGNEWGVGRELLWAPSTSSPHPSEVLPGLYKVQGETVQAMIGAIYHQYGGAVAQRVFHTRLLPLLLVPGGIPQQFHGPVRAFRDRMGGPTGPLLVPNEKQTSKVEAPPTS